MGAGRERLRHVAAASSVVASLAGFFFGVLLPSLALSSTIALSTALLNLNFSVLTCFGSRDLINNSASGLLGVFGSLLSVQK